MKKIWIGLCLGLSALLTPTIKAQPVKQIMAMCQAPNGTSIPFLGSLLAPTASTGFIQQAQLISLAPDGTNKFVQCDANGDISVGSIQQTGNSTTPCNGAAVSPGVRATCIFTLSSANLIAFDGSGQGTAFPIISAPGSGLMINIDQVTSIADYVAGSTPYSGDLNLVGAYAGNLGNFTVYIGLHTSLTTSEISFTAPQGAAGLTSVVGNAAFDMFAALPVVNGIGTSTIDAPGLGFAVNDTFTTDTACLNQATGTVTGIGAGGSITTYTFDGAGNSRGAYCNTGAGATVTAVSPSTGTGASINILTNAANGNGTVVLTIPYTVVAVQ